MCGSNDARIIFMLKWNVYLLLKEDLDLMQERLESMDFSYIPSVSSSFNSHQRIAKKLCICDNQYVAMDTELSPRLQSSHYNSLSYIFYVTVPYTT